MGSEPKPPIGCICPPGANEKCQRLDCPRKPPRRVGLFPGERIPPAKSPFRRPGENGGFARAAKLSPERRREIAVAAARARWDASSD